jgi:hypothetical protein
MELLLSDHVSRLRANQEETGKAIEAGTETQTHQPVVKLFCPWGGSTWLLTELDPDMDRAFGLCDLGVGCPELGYVSLTELRKQKGPFDLRIERDIHFTAKKSIIEYANEAAAAGAIRAY